jgi:hypothetical protein
VSPVELIDRRGRGGGGRGAKPYDREQAWSSINHSILSGGQTKAVQCPNCTYIFKKATVKIVEVCSKEGEYSNMIVIFILDEI